MKFKYLFLLAFLLSFNTNSKDNYFCLSNGKNSILLVSKNYPNISEVKYYPYLKSIKISEIIKKEYGDDAGEKPEVYYTMNELINGKNTGKYVFMSRGYVLYSVDYLNFKSKKITEFSRIYNYEINLKNINFCNYICLNIYEVLKKINIFFLIIFEYYLC